MPVRSLHSSVLKWPDREAVCRALTSWTEQAVHTLPSILKVGYFGSYARGDWGVGSDLDLIVIVDHTARAFVQRPSLLDTTPLPVPVDLVIYTKEEWDKLQKSSGFPAGLRTEVVWIYRRDAASRPT